MLCSTARPNCSRASAGCEPQQGAASGVPACRPLQWRLPQTEAPHYACPLAGSLALVHGGEPPAAAALKAGASSAEASKLLDDPFNTTKPGMWC